MICNHEQFTASTQIARLTATENPEDTEAVSYAADIRIHCAQCGVPFSFVGVSRGGLSPAFPTSSLDGQELRAPIVPCAPQAKGQG